MILFNGRKLREKNDKQMRQAEGEIKRLKNIILDKENEKEIEKPHNVVKIYKNSCPTSQWTNCDP